MPTSTGIKVIMGGTGLLRAKPGAEVPKLLSTLTAHKITKIDSAVIYGDSEELLGLNDAGATFTLDTKIPGGLKPGTATRDQVIETGRASLARLKVKQVDVLYIHGPDTTVPFVETLDGLNVLHREGAFRRLGLSNFTPEQVREVHGICGREGFVRPAVYQGNYNAFARSYEVTLLPVLRELGMSFYAYSPQAGGFLSKTSELVSSGKGEGRVLGNAAGGDIYKALYKKPSLMEGLTRWNEIANEAGVKPGDMAARWVRFNSALKNEFDDAIIVGARTLEQVDQTLGILEQGPLADDVVSKIDEVWETVKHEAPVDNYHDFVKNNLNFK